MKKIITLLILLPVFIYGQHVITVDGSASDWIGTPSATPHATVYSNGEFIYTGQSNDERTDFNTSQPSSDNDIIEVRFTLDATSLYILVKMRDITNVDYPHLCFVFTNGSSNQTFIGDDSYRSNANASSATSLGNSSQYGRLLDIHSSSSGTPVIELYNGGSWYGVGSTSVSISTINDLVEAKIALSDLGLTSSSSTNISLMTCPNRVGWNNDVDATAWGIDNQTNGVDVMTPSASPSTNAWFRDLNDGDVDTYASVDLGSVPLPVELTSFIALAGKDGVQLNWSTATEVNNYGFDIERCVAQIGNLCNNWEKIGFVQGHGNSNSPKDYSFVDANPPAGKVLYKLKQIDFDGTFEYSKAVEVNVETPQEFRLAQNYPNPFNPSTVINYQLPKDGNVTLKVYDMLGREVATLVNEYQKPGIYNYKFSIANYQLPSGIYIYQLKAGNFIETKKLMILK